MKERDGYRKILESYDSEVTREVVPLHADKATQLQITLNSYIKSNEQLEQDILLKEKENLSLKHTVTEVLPLRMYRLTAVATVVAF